jgi:hypothetical protein
MVKRVSIRGGQSAAMTVSLPGVDVTNATINQTCFDSRWSGYTPYAIGQIVSGNDNPSMFFFPETLDQPPMCLCHFATLGPSGAPAGGAGEFTPTMLRGNGTDQWWYVLVTANFLQFRSKFGGQNSRLTFSLFRRTAG